MMRREDILGQNVVIRNRGRAARRETVFQGKVGNQEKKETVSMAKVVQQEGIISNLTTEVRILKQKLAFLQKVKLEILREELSLGDVTFVVDGKIVIKAHRFMLASKSSMFRKMFYTDMKEKTSGEIHIKDVSAPILQAVVDFVYTAEITFGADVPAADVFRVAHRFDIPELQLLCESELVKSVSVENVSEMLKISYLYCLENLRERSVKVFKDNFDQVHSKVISELLS